jgi:hypothetical protein
MQRRTFSRMILVLALSSLPVIAQEGNGWQFDSLGLNTTSPESDAQQVYDVLLKLLDRWNAHDAVGSMETGTLRLVEPVIKSIFMSLEKLH